MGVPATEVAALTDDVPAIKIVAPAEGGGETADGADPQAPQGQGEKVCPDLCQMPTPLLHCYLTPLLTISQSRNLALRIDAGLANAQSWSSASPALSPNTPTWQPTGTSKLSSSSPPASK